MLVLSRKKSEQIVIYREDDFEVIAKAMVVDIRGDKVRIGFGADKKIKIDRREVFEQRKRERKRLQAKVEDDFDELVECTRRAV